MTAKNIYQDIMKFIKFREAELSSTQELKVFLINYPQFEVTRIGRVGDNYLIFAGQSSQGIHTTLLLPAEAQPLNLVTVDLSDQPDIRPNRIGFLEHS
ncbi:hypothetical protein [Phascolarctobacterium faecium]|uniref:hypothetical protein n=1 Tax=Phascolarctobacterium faecium TaxID=33025 RepID=UPI003AB5590D